VDTADADADADAAPPPLCAFELEKFMFFIQYILKSLYLFVRNI
jgi:hypothetical protein